MAMQLVEIREALRQALDEEMTRDERVFVIGEEVDVQVLVECCGLWSAGCRQKRESGLGRLQEGRREASTRLLLGLWRVVNYCGFL